MSDTRVQRVVANLRFLATKTDGEVGVGRISHASLLEAAEVVELTENARVAMAECAERFQESNLALLHQLAASREVSGTLTEMLKEAIKELGALCSSLDNEIGNCRDHEQMHESGALPDIVYTAEAYLAGIERGKEQKNDQ